MPNTHINDASELKYKSTHSKITASLQSIAECHRHLNRNVNEHNNKNLVYYWTLCKNCRFKQNCNNDTASRYWRRKQL